MIIGIQIFGILFGLFMLYLTYLYQKKRQLTTREWGFWSVLWIFFIILSLIPSSLDFLVKDILQMGRTLDFLIVIGFMFLIGISFYNYSIVRRTEKRVEEIVRKLAIRNGR